MWRKIFKLHTETGKVLIASYIGIIIRNLQVRLISICYIAPIIITFVFKMAILLVFRFGCVFVHPQTFLLLPHLNFTTFYPTVSIYIYAKKRKEKVNTWTFPSKKKTLPASPKLIHIWWEYQYSINASQQPFHLWNKKKIARKRTNLALQLYISLVYFWGFLMSSSSQSYFFFQTQFVTRRSCNKFMQMMRVRGVFIYCKMSEAASFK